jgi:hypothetical protein
MDIIFDYLGFQSVPASEFFVVRRHVNSIYIVTVASD